jgi:hypothetical protein
MSKLKNLISTETVGWVKYPDIKDFEVQIKFITREDLIKVRKASLKIAFNKKTRQKEEEVDTDLFLEKYAERAIKDWRGLKIKHLPKLLPVNIAGMNGEEEVPFDMEDAVDMLKNSADFDAFLTETLADYEAFVEDTKVDNIKN